MPKNVNNSLKTFLYDNVSDVSEDFEDEQEILEEMCVHTNNPDWMIQEDYEE